MASLAAVIGLLSGGAAWALVHLIGLITNFALFHRYGWELPSFEALEVTPLVVLTAMVGAGIVPLLAKWSPVLRGHSLPAPTEALHTTHSRTPPRTPLAN